MQFTRHYTLEQARQLLPQVRTWLGELNRLREVLVRQDERNASRFALGEDLGGAGVRERVEHLLQFQSLLEEFRRREIQIKDLERGLIDFPAIIGGREVFLCWEQDEDDIEHWHDLDAGYAGREKLPE
ncbi:MAG: hypothetical protein RJA22_2073 [Verrucomicrobiota bacterium]|jgi:hypothetical protein